MAEKSEKATPKKLRDARKKGQVARSQDFPSAFTFITSITTTLCLTKYLFNQLGGFTVAVFNSIRSNTDFSSKISGMLGESLLVILQSSIPISALTACVGVLVSFLVVGPVFSTQVLKFDVKRLNPVTNLKNMFKLKTLIELLKSLLKITIALFIIYSVINKSLPELVATAAMPLLGAAQVFYEILFKVIIRIGIFFIIVAIFDLAFQRYNFAKEMKMEKFEVKQEYKDTEGDPHIKGKRRQVAQEIAYQDGPSSAKRAKAIITNPIHIAVAIDYLEEKEPAPRIITMGQGIMADQIIRFAQEAHVPIMRNVPLAQRLFKEGKIGNFVPESTYEDIADILQWIKRLEEKEETGDLFQ
ncbi:MAG: type III secretion system export apparatus subunit SctU [Candidatus Rhabdochlamydia sp.]